MFPSIMSHLLDRVAVVSGVARSKGIGRACVRKLLTAGYKVVGVDRVTEECTNDLSTASKDKRYVFVQADISDITDVIKIKSAVQQSFGDELHGLINSAAIVDPYMPTGKDERLVAWSRYINVNLTGAFLMSEVLSPMLSPARSSIVHVSSTRARQSEPNCEGYAAAKAGLVGLAHAQAASMAHKSRVNVVLPGWIDTSDNADTIRPEDHHWHWTGSVGTPDDVAEVCLFLLDETKSGFITGQEFVVDGGVSRRMVYPPEDHAG